MLLQINLNVTCGADIFQSLSPSKPRSEVAYCIHSLARRLNQTNNWAVCS